jgi:exopolysaccharide biosynthesis polyprenyl glycosylphosphotransferase
MAYLGSAAKWWPPGLQGKRGVVKPSLTSETVELPVKPAPPVAPSSVSAPAGEEAFDQAALPSRRPVIRRRDAIFRRLLALADMAAVTLALVVAEEVVGHGGLAPAAVAVPLLFIVVAKAMGLYDRDEHLLHRATLDELPSLFGLATLATLLASLTSELFVQGPFGRSEVLVFWIALTLGMVSFRALARLAALKLAPVERCLLVGDAQTAEYIRVKLIVSPAVKAELVDVVTPDRFRTTGLPEGLGGVLTAQGIDRVILAVDPAGRDELLYTIRELKEYGVKVSVLPEASRVAGSSVELDHLHGVTLLGMRRFEFSRSSRLIKRTMDLAGAGATLLLLMPLLLAVALAIRIDSRGPILFRQRRVGLHGHEFEMLKFRSMVSTAEQLKDELRHLNEGADGLFKIPGDPRVTRVGRWMRSMQVDELPQLWNVVRGEMSLVGPRPLIPEEDRKIEGWYRRRLDVPPGITGHWQILGSSRHIPLAEMVKLDYLYVANWSLWGDIRLLLRTVPFLIRRRGV